MYVNTVLPCLKDVCSVALSKQCVLPQAMAAHNSGGVVIVQVERIVDRGTMNTRHAHIPGAMVDKIVLAPAENHWMHLGSQHYDGSLSGMAMHHHWYH